MKEKVKEAVDVKIRHLNMFVNDVYTSVEEGVKTLNVELDSDLVIDVDRITDASKIINPIMDELDLIDGEYVLDIHSKVKGDSSNE